MNFYYCKFQLIKTCFYDLICTLSYNLTEYEVSIGVRSLGGGGNKNILKNGYIFFIIKNFYLSNSSVKYRKIWNIARFLKETAMHVLIDKNFPKQWL